MFGLTKREQRWKAEQRAAEVLAALAGTAMKAAAEVRVAEAQADAAELARLRAEAASFQMAYRLKCDEELKAQALEIERLRAKRAEMRQLLAVIADNLGDMPISEEWAEATAKRAVALLDVDS